MVQPPAWHRLGPRLGFRFLAPGRPWEAWASLSHTWPCGHEGWKWPRPPGREAAAWLTPKINPTGGPRRPRSTTDTWPQTMGVWASGPFGVLCTEADLSPTRYSHTPQTSSSTAYEQPNPEVATGEGGGKGSGSAWPGPF